MNVGQGDVTGRTPADRESGARGAIELVVPSPLLPVEHVEHDHPASVLPFTQGLREGARAPITPANRRSNDSRLMTSSSEKSARGTRRGDILGEGMACLELVLLAYDDAPLRLALSTRIEQGG